MCRQYQLDDSIDFHNSAEPSTTSCPLLPGQLVNVLNVPFHLYSGRPRNDSISSTSSELRTMNPEDKFLNPRPVPVPQPKLPRLNTSPTLPTFPQPSDSSTRSGSPWSAMSLSSSRGESPPISATTLRKLRLPRKPSIDGASRSISPQNKTTGLRAAIRQFASQRSISPEGESNRGRRGQADYEMEISAPIIVGQAGTGGNIGKPSSNASSRSVSRENSPTSIVARQPSAQTSQLALRRGLNQPADLQNDISATSLQSHRRQRSLSREPSSLRNPLTLQDQAEPVVIAMDQHYQPLETLKEAPSQQNTPKWPVTAVRIGDNYADHLTVDPLLEKRLPTLPSSPSSAYPPSAASDSPAKRLSEELKNMQSHFSEMTMSSATTSSIVDTNCSHFSHWTSTSTEHSPSSDYCIGFVQSSDRNSSPHHQPSSPYEVVSTPFKEEKGFSREDTFTSDAEMLPSTISCSTISSCVSTSPPSPLCNVTETGSGRVDNPVPSEALLDPTTPHDIESCHLSGYSLPQEVPVSGTRHKVEERSVIQEEATPHTSRVGIRRPNSVTFMPKHKGFPHSTSMQQLLDELSYLGDMIHK